MKIGLTNTVDEVAGELGARLRKLRLSRNWTQSELARRAGLSRISIARLEADACDVKLPSFLAVCSALGLMGRFDMLVDDVELTPQQILDEETLPQRASRKRVVKRVKWGDEQ